MAYSIKVKHGAPTLEGMPIGTIVISEMYSGEEPYLIPMEGQYLSCEEYPEAYEILKDSYCPKYTWEKVKFNFIEKLIRALRRDTSIPFELVTNPKYREGYFRLPDTRP